MNGGPLSRRGPRLLLGVAALLSSTSALADEGGVAFWWSGQNASMAAVPLHRGFTLTAYPYFYHGSASDSVGFERGGGIAGKLSADIGLVFLQALYAPDTTFLGGQPAFGLGSGIGKNGTTGTVTLTLPDDPNPITLKKYDSVFGAMDLYPAFTNAWNKGVNNWMIYLGGDIPLGAYDHKRLSNLGIGHGAVDAGGAYTYLNPKNGREFSAELGFTYNLENHSTNYRNGIDSHLDWAFSQFLSQTTHVGIVGYLYYQLSGDSGSGDRVGPFKSKIASIGPEVGHMFKVGQNMWYANLRGYYEFWAQHRVNGYALFITLNAPLTPPKHP